MVVSIEESTTFWHPFADMSAVNGHELVVVSGEGARVRTKDGREFIDASAALWFNSVGHGRKELAEAAAAQMMTLAAYSNFGDQATESTLRLSDRLSALSPQKDCKVFFTSGGSDAVDTAVKMVRRYWWLNGQPERTWIITRNRAYHGMHMAGTALAGIAANRDGHGNLDSRVRNIQWDSAAELVAVIDELRRGDFPGRDEALAMLDGIEMLSLEDAVFEIVEAYLAHKLMPVDPFGDALHLALASYHRCDFLVTWNCQHLANANKFGQIRRINGILGLFTPELVTPMELLGGNAGP